MTREPKYAKIADALRREISLMKPGDQLDTERVLAERFQTTVLTLRNAVNLLVDEGRVSRQQGRGTFVTDPESLKTYNNIVLYCGQHTGDLFQQLFDEVSRALHSRHYSPLVFNTALELPDDEKMRLFQSMLKIKPKFIIIVGEAAFPIWMFEEIKEPLPPVFAIYHKEFETTVPCHEIIVDEVSGGYFLAEHLYQSGHRNVAYLVPSHGSEESRLARYSDSIRHGFADYMLRCGDLTLTDIPFGRDTREEKIREFAREVKKMGITAVVTTMDFVAIQLINELKTNGIEVPGDVAVTGYNNTPWAYHGNPPLTTVSPNIGEIARILMMNVDRLPRKPHTWLVQPRLIVQASTEIERTT